MALDYGNYGIFLCMGNAGSTGLLSDQGEKSRNFYFIMVPLRKKVLKVWYSKA